MDTDLASFIQLTLFPTGRRLFVLRRLSELAAAKSFSALADLVTQALAHDEQTYDLELRWKSRRAASRPAAKATSELRALDAQVDRTLTAFRDAADALTRSAQPDESELVDKVDTLLADLFPAGVQAVTSLSYPEEATAVAAIVKKLNTQATATVVADLGLKRHADRITGLASKYEAALKNATTEMDFGTLRAARAVGQGYLLQIIALVLGAHHKPDGDDAAARATFLAPIVKQEEAIRHHIRARRSAPDVDPKTGVEVPDDAPSTETEGGRVDTPA